MDSKKWPILAQILIGLGCIGGIIGIIQGIGFVAGGYVFPGGISVVFGVIGLIIYWSVYKFKVWSLKWLTIWLSLGILVLLLSIFGGGASMLIGFIAIAFNGFVIYYFNSAKIEILFSQDNASVE